MPKSGSSRGLWLPCLLAALTPVGGFASSSCAAPPQPRPADPLRVADGGYELQVLLQGAPVRTFTHAGESFVMGQMGSRYTLRVVNHTGHRVEAVVSVDGRDVLDGKPADFRSKRGYLVPAWGAADIDGWRLSQTEVAAFRFGTVADSYAARTGSAREVGVIGVAVFPGRQRFHFMARPDPDAAEAGDRGESLGYSASADSFAENPKSGAPSAPSPRSGSPGGRAARAEAAPTPSAPASAFAERQSAAPPARRRLGLATEFGEAVSSAVHEVSFTRENPTTPSVLLGVRYNDREGLVALGVDVDGCCATADELAVRQTATPFPNSAPRFASPPAGWRKGCCGR